MQIGDLRNNERSMHFAPLIANAAPPKRSEKMPFDEQFEVGINRIAAALLRSIPSDPHGTI